ncbi:MAG: HAD family hydrolase [Caldilineaceae bacterium]|nr:HAD family hydrolase [Caldilineaceae bacterium]
MFELSCDAILFDLDGVLVDSSPVIQRQWQRWATLHHIDMAAIQAIWHGRRAFEIIGEVAPHLDVDEESRWMRDAEAADVEGVIEQPGAIALLKLLPVESWAIATSGPRAVATARLHAVGIPVPQHFVTGDDVRNGKPHPEPYLLAAQTLGIAPERCVVIEDAVAGVEAGLAAGAQVIAVPTSHPAHELTRATVIVPRLADMRVAVSTGPAMRLTLSGPNL